MSTEQPLNRYPNGSLIAERRGLKKHFASDIYHDLMRMSWRKLILLFIFSYLAVNSLFALCYYVAGDAITNADTGSYWDCFFFSFQTSATIGYGQFLPNHFLAHIIVIFDCMSGLFLVAVATGLMFAKISRPTAHVLFSNKVVITPFDGVPTLMFRIGNGRESQILDAEVNVVYTKPYLSEEKHKLRKMFDLKLHRSRTPLFFLSWTVMHPITESSPLYALLNNSHPEEDFNFIVSITGIDDVYSQVIYDRHIYTKETLIFGHHFRDIMSIDQNNTQIIDYSKFHELVSDT